MTKYVAMWNMPGCLPDTTEELPEFDYALDAWKYLSDEYQRDGETAWLPSDPSDPDGPQQLDAAALEMERRATGSFVQKLGSVTGRDGYVYTVDEAIEDGAPLHNGVIGMGHTSEYR